MKYKFKAFVGPLLFLWTSVIGFGFLDSSLMGSPCSYSDCLQDKIPLLELTEKKFSIDLTGFLVDEKTMVIISIVLATIFLLNLYLGFKAHHLKKKVVEEFGLGVDEKLTGTIKSIRTNFSVALFITIIIFLLCYMGGIKVGNPDYLRCAQGHHGIFDTKTNSFISIPGC